MSDTAPDTDITSTGTENSEQAKRWRDVLPVHPAAELFPLMSDAELRELADDIEANGLLEKVTVIEQDGVPHLLDGRNRLDALELLGRKIFVSKYDPSALHCGECPKRVTQKKRREALAADRDLSSPSNNIFENASIDNPFAFVLSKNVHRRHLTPEEKRPLIVKLVKASAERSNAVLAEWADVDDHYISDIREELEATSEIPRFEKTIGKDGKARPTRKHTEPQPKPTAPEITRATVPLLGPTARNQVALALSDAVKGPAEPMTPDEFMDRAFPLLEGGLRPLLAEMAKSDPVGAYACVEKIATQLLAAIDEAVEAARDGTVPQ
jgi:hypothetical protein